MAVNRLVQQKVDETLEKNYMPYAMSVIVSRALPEIDGFKPSHRKLLYTMYLMGLLKGNRTKSANVVGQTMKLNPHGDMAIYETMVRLTRGHEALLHPFVDSKGNFGKYYSRDMLFAAPRYTEVKLDVICSEIFKDLDKNAVDFVDNYDGSLKEPVLLPTTFPNILVNSNQGIAVGMASNICSFNLKEVCRTTIEYLKNPEINIADYLVAPDFSTGGKLIYNRDEMEKIYAAGRGSFKVRANYRYNKAESYIEIFEIPYTTSSEAIIEAIIDLVKSGKIKEITDVRDEIDLKGMKIAIEIKKSADPDDLMNKLYKLTSLEDSFNCNFNVLVNGRPKVMGIKEILDAWTDFRINNIRRQSQYDIDRKNEKLHLLTGLKKILLDIDRAIKIIRGTEHDRDVIPNLMKEFEIDNLQAEFIAEIKLRNLNREYVLNKIGEIGDLKREIANLEELCSSNDRIKKEIIKQLEYVSDKYALPRKTVLVREENIETITTEQLIEDYNLKLYLTEHNYLKKLPLVSLRSNPELKLKEDDYFLNEIETHNKSELLLFSDKQTVYKLRIYDIEDCKPSELGIYLPNLLEMQEGERIINITATDDYTGNMLFSFENGKVAKIDMAGYETKTNRKKLTNAYSDKSPVIDARFLSEDMELVVYSNINKMLLYNTGQIAAKTTRSAQGVQVMKQKKNSRMIKVETLSESGLINTSYYSTANIPAVGHYRRDADFVEKQLVLDIDKEQG